MTYSMDTVYIYLKIYSQKLMTFIAILHLKLILIMIEKSQMERF